MRIDAYNQINQLYQTTKMKKVTRKNETSAKEQYTVSSKGQDYQTAKNALADVPDIRKEKVEALKEQIATGSYNVSAQEIADAMVSKIFDSTI